MIETVREQLVMILHTSEGAKVTMSCLWHGTPKVRISTLHAKFRHRKKLVQCNDLKLLDSYKSAVDILNVLDEIDTRLLI